MFIKCTNVSNSALEWEGLEGSLRFFGWTPVWEAKRNVPDSDGMGATGLVSIEIYLITEQRKSISGDRKSFMEVPESIMEAFKSISEAKSLMLICLIFVFITVT
jgi:hypothetical protein